jgi:hypothetical protein
MCGSEHGVCSYMLDKRSSGSESEVLLSELRVGMSRQSQIISLDMYIIHILQTCRGLVISYPHPAIPKSRSITMIYVCFSHSASDPSAGDSRTSGYETTILQHQRRDAKRLIGMRYISMIFTEITSEQHTRSQPTWTRGSTPLGLLPLTHHLDPAGHNASCSRYDRSE